MYHPARPRVRVAGFGVSPFGFMGADVYVFNREISLENQDLIDD